jgi:hypothetical protein
MNDALSFAPLRRRPAGAALLLLVLFLGGVALTGTGVAHAQTRGDGSVYSSFGLGELRTFSSAQAQAMGGGGLALRSLNYSGFANPALLSDQELTRLNLGARYRQVDARNGTGQTSRLSNGALQAVQFSFPLYAEELGVGIGFRPYSRVEYRVQGDADFVTEPPIGGGPRQDSTRFQISYEGEGGLQEISGGLGYRIGDALAIGARVNVIFGILENQRRTFFSDPDFLPTTLAQRTRLAGVTGTAGALLSLSGVLREEDALSVGATFTLPTRLSGERTRTLGESLNRDTLSLGNGDTVEEGGLTVPLSGALGISYKPSAYWTLVADGRYEPWSGAENDFDTALPSFSDLRDRARASAGVELLPAGENRNESFFERTAYRLGGYYEQTYIGAATLPAGAAGGVDVMAATGGFSLPTPLYGTRIDVGFEVGTRGTTDDGLVRDLFYGISLNVNFGERWFQRRKLR